MLTVNQILTARVSAEPAAWLVRWCLQKVLRTMVVKRVLLWDMLTIAAELKVS